MLADLLLWSTLVALDTGTPPTLRVEVAYRAPANAFEILDNVSEWWPGYTEPEYRRAWVESYGMTPADEAILERYAQLRSRYFDRTGQQDADPRTGRSGLFTDRAALTADPLAFAFYRAETLEEAFHRLGSVLEPEEVGFLRSFYGHFSERLAPLLAATEQSIKGALDRTRGELADPAVEAYLDEIAEFFEVDGEVTFTALYVWWPDADRVMANPNGPFLLLRVLPHEGETLSNADVVVHEAVHVVSALQPDAQKRSLTEAMLAACPGVLELTRRLGVIEEPLATVLGNMEYRRRFDRARFAWGRSWYGEPWVDLLARLLYPAVIDALGDGRTVSSTFSTDASQLCAVAAKVFKAV